MSFRWVDGSEVDSESSPWSLLNDDNDENRSEGLNSYEKWLDVLKLAVVVESNTIHPIGKALTSTCSHTLIWLFLHLLRPLTDGTAAPTSFCFMYNLHMCDGKGQRGTLWWHAHILWPRATYYGSFLKLDNEHVLVQSLQEVTVNVLIPYGTKSMFVACDIKMNHLKVELKGQHSILEEDFCQC
nr:hypothetical protein [Tanacetum cinerariifolium]